MTVHHARAIALSAVLFSIALVPLAACTGAQTIDELQALAEESPTLRARAEQGDADAQFSLGVLSGEGFQRNGIEAARWIRLAADQGHASAQHTVGIMYQTGEGVPQDYAEMVRWIRLAADQGHAGGQSALGRMYQSGEHVPQDYAEAVRLYFLSADQGHAPAQGLLAGMYQRGAGISRDAVEAHMWSNLAAAQSRPDREVYVRIRDRLSYRMTADQIAEAQRRARELMVCSRSRVLLGFGQNPACRGEAVRWRRVARCRGRYRRHVGDDAALSPLVARRPSPASAIQGKEETLMGCIYKRGTTYWIKYSRNGRPYFESARSTKKEEATRILRLREGDIARAPGCP